MRQLLLLVVSTVTVVNAAASAAAPPQLSRVVFGSGQAINIEQEYDGAEEGSVLWDASRTLLAHVAHARESGIDEISGKRLLEIGSGTGAVGLALACMGAKSVILTDKASQLPLMRRNLRHNQPESGTGRGRSSVLAPVSIHCLPWGAQWQSEADASLSAADAFDTIVCCDCVYPDRPSGLATVLLDLVALNPKSTMLLAFERRPPPADAPPGTDHTRDFFEVMRAGCDVERVADAELDPHWACDEISLWRMRARTC